MSARAKYGAAGLLVLAALVLMPVFLAGCGGGSDSGGPGEVTELLTIEQALAAEEGQAIRVAGHLVATETQVVLASALLESYPPQAGGAVLPIEGLDLSALVGLSSTASQPDLAQVSWSDHPVVVAGILKTGVLQAQEVPAFVAASAAELRVRFCPPSEPPASGDTVWWVFDVTNTGAAPVEIVFSSGQIGEVVLSQNGTEMYRWSEGKVFTQAITTTTIVPGQTVAYVFNDVVSVAPGAYDVKAMVTASLGPEGAATPLPELVTTLTVR